MTPFPYEEFSASFPWFFPLAAALFGACIGSFLNVCIVRIPDGRSVVKPRSHCGCGQPIAWFDNIPLFSWMLLRGRARCCGRPVSARYPMVELLTAVLFVICWLQYADRPAVVVCGWILIGCLVPATFIDLEHMIIPDIFTIGLALIGIILALAVPALHGQSSGWYLIDSLRSGIIAVQGLLIGSGLVLWIALIGEVVLKKDAMGGADIKLVGAIGAFSGWQGAVFSMFGGAVVALVWIGIALAWPKKAGDTGAILKTETPEGQPAPLGFGAQVPFGPMLAIAGLIHFLWLREPFARYLADFGEILSSPNW